MNPHDWQKTYWQGEQGGVTTIQDVLLELQGESEVEIKLADLAHIPSTYIEEHRKLMADLSFPIIVQKKDGEYQVLNETINNLNRKIEGAKASVRDAEMDIASNENKLEKIQRANTKTKIIEEEISKYTEYLVKQISELEKSEYDKLIDQIESSANISFEDITSVNKTIDGNIKIDRNTFRVLNVDDSGRELKNYNTGHYTLMKMCIINAIISLTNDYKNTAYPFITDAPTSNLDEKATFAYLESISETFDQSIVITKDISEDEIESIKNQNYIKGLFQLKIKNDTGNDKMNRTEAYSTITSII